MNFSRRCRPLHPLPPLRTQAFTNSYKQLKCYNFISVSASFDVSLKASFENAVPALLGAHFSAIKILTSFHRNPHPNTYISTTIPYIYPRCYTTGASSGIGMPASTSACLVMYSMYIRVYSMLFWNVGMYVMFIWIWGCHIRRMWQR